MSMELNIDTFLKKLALPHKVDLVKEIFSFLEIEVKTENANGNEEKIAKLFCRAIESLNQDEKPDEDLQQAILRAFENIRTIENNTHENGELMCIYLLNLLYSQNDSFEEIADKDFSLLLDNLEKIRCIFKSTDLNNNAIFPIGSLLFKLINSENLLFEIKKASSIQALMLALQVFDSSQYPQELKDIENMIEGKDLRFIEYLYRKCTRLGDDDWKENYEKNGLLVLYDSTVNKILIRNNKPTYFRTVYDIHDYMMGPVIAEKNANREPIAFFVEYSLDDFKNINLKKEFSVENNKERISQILDIIYYYQNYNVVFESALFERGGRIYPTNPFGTNDLYVVHNGTSHKDGNNYVSKLLYKHGLLKITGIGLEYVNLGVLVKLDEIFAIPFKDFKLNDSSSLNDVIGNWLEHCRDKQKCFDEFYKDFEEQIKYIYTQKSIFEKKYDNEYLIPGFVSEHILEKLELDDKFSLFGIERCNVKIDFLQEKRIITNSNGDVLQDYEVEDIVGEDVSISEGDIFALINDAEKKIYVGKQVNYYYLMSNKITQINSFILDDTVLKRVKENDVNNIAKKMECFKEALKTIHPGLPMESIARYRLLNHLMLIKPSGNEIKEWLLLIAKHEIEDFSIVVKHSPIDSAEGVLYVPKDRPRTQSTLKHINDRYFNNPIKRSLVDIYDQLIEKKGNYYYTGGKKIERVVFLFDNIQNGKSTKETIDYYINAKKEDQNDKRMHFICDGKEITFSEILKTNKCAIKIFSIYAGDIGIDAVKRHVNAKYPNINIEVLDPIKKLTVVVKKQDVDIINKFYPGKLAGEIRENCYLVVREYNQPKLNIMCHQLLEIERVAAFFCKRAEL